MLVAVLGSISTSLSNKMTDSSNNKVNVLMVGTGEYTTGYVGGTASDSDKGAGVVALTMFDLRRRSKVERVGMCGVNVSSFLLFCLCDEGGRKQLDRPNHQIKYC